VGLSCTTQGTVFFLQVFLERIPTKENLIRRNLAEVVGDSNCVLCLNAVESVKHLFLSCPFSLNLWPATASWLGFLMDDPVDFFDFYLLFRSKANNKKRKKVIMLIWNSVLWTIWKMRNEVIFNQATVDFVGAFDLVKVRSWT